uniref:Aspartyl-tRNA(Asn) amidotransferase subunit A amidotransferase subunit A n=1 Tax=uncultured bacterium A1Q1_fos_1870 TaxID=1256554 RepID=L7VTU1_9BACT|nr:aspartyl-tRNA(Asn) amidotransferase subunit A amidotransferase subunit A [uncultured bacterium A1Q1_fos_1870]
MTDATETADATTLADRVRRKEVHPTELVAAAIAAIEKVNPSLNAVVHRMYEKAKAAAGGELPQGPFRGVPFVVKDLDGWLAGEPYTQSCRMSKDFIPPEDSELMMRIKRTGVVIVGKTNTPELGLLGITEPELRGPARNPWNLEHTPGGSSGGTAAIVAARAVPMGHGGDGGGSLRIPSSACGLFGLKPSRGRNPLGPQLAEGWGGYVQPGVITRSVRDCAAMLDATQGPDVGAPYAAPPRERPYLEELGRAPRKLRIAFSTGAQLGRETHDDVKEAVRAAAALCSSLGHELEEAPLPIEREALVSAYFTQVAVGAAIGIEYTSKWVGRSPKPADFEPTTWLLATIGRKLSALELQRSRDACQAAGRSLGRFFCKYDLFLDGTLAFPPIAVGQLELDRSQRLLLAALRWVSPKAVLDKVLTELGDDALKYTPNTQVANQTGVPAMSVPLHWNAAGLPIGVQFTAPLGGESTLFQLAAQLEAARPWAHRLPPVCAPL